MAIQVRRGANADFDSSKMLPGELAVTTDGSRKVYVAFQAGDTKELVSKEEVQGIVDNTLTVSGKAADAAVVGKEVSKLSGEIESITERVTAANASIDFSKYVTYNEYGNYEATEDGISISTGGVDVGIMVPIEVKSGKTYTIRMKITGINGTLSSHYIANDETWASASRITDMVNVSSNIYEATFTTNDNLVYYIFRPRYNNTETIVISDVSIYDGDAGPQFVVSGRKIAPKSIPVAAMESNQVSQFDNDAGYISKSQMDDITFLYESDNLYDPNNDSQIIPGHVLSSSGELSASTGYSVIRIPVSDINASYNVYVINSTGTTWQRTQTRIAMYDADHNPLGLLVNNTNAPAVITDDDCCYLYAYLSDTYLSNSVHPPMFLRNGSEKYSNYIPCESSLKIKTSLYGKNVLAYGDSITAISNGVDKRVGWIRYIDREFGLGNYYGRGVGGQRYVWNDNTCQVDADGNYVSRGTVDDNCKGCFCSWDRISKMIPDSIKDTIDLILLMGGTNDLEGAEEIVGGSSINYVKPVWSAANTTDMEWASAAEYNGGDYDVTIFSGAIASTIMKLQTRCPNARIVVLTPLSRWANNQNYDVNGANTMDVADTEIKVARYMAAPYIDINGTTGINGYNYPQYITDGIHPYNDAGKKALANAIIGGLRNVFID